jgi:uncharacterized protein YecE (DUF72 family)
MDVRVGTSGFSYPEWKGSFYPKDLPASKMLAYYAERFGTVEANNTFYRLPKPEMLTDWAAKVPESFRFVVKASQRITHHKRLKDCEDVTKYFLDTVQALGPKLGPLLFQLPPYLKKDLLLLSDFLQTIPKPFQVALELGDVSWHTEEVFELLREHNVTVVQVDDEKRPLVLTHTADFGYLRLRRVEYSDADLAAWAQRVLAAPWKQAWIFFKHEDEGTGPKLAKAFMAHLPGRSG